MDLKFQHEAEVEGEVAVDGTKRVRDRGGSRLHQRRMGVKGTVVDESDVDH